MGGKDGASARRGGVAVWLCWSLCVPNSRMGIAPRYIVLLSEYPLPETPEYNTWYYWYYTSIWARGVYFEVF